MNIEKEIDSIKERNKKVELDKAWELSFFRRFIIAVLTYLLIVLFLFYFNIERPFLNAIIPALAFLISTLSLNIFKRMWIKYFYKN